MIAVIVIAILIIIFAVLIKDATQMPDDYED